MFLFCFSKLILNQFVPPYLRPVHPGQSGGQPAKGVAAEAEERPGEEVSPGDEVEEEEVHHHPANDQNQHYQQPERSAQPPFDPLTELRPPLGDISVQDWFM